MIRYRISVVYFPNLQCKTFFIDAKGGGGNADEKYAPPKGSRKFISRSSSAFQSK